MKIIIIGAGITGITSALFAKKIGYKEIYLYERSKLIGGILKDANFENQVSFLPNCQYFDAKSPIFEVIDKNLFYEFNHLYGSYSKFNNNLITRSDYAGPIFFSNSNDIITQKEKHLIGNVHEYFDAYPDWISRQLNLLFKKFSQKELIHSSCLSSIQMQRIFIEDRINEVYKLKNKDIAYDEIYGLPRKDIGLKKTKSCLPNGGFDNLFKNIYLDLLDKNIKLNLGENIDPVFTEDGFKLISKGKKINSPKDLVVWTADPNKFLLMENPPLRYSPVEMNNFYFKTNIKQKNPVYIQVFDLNSPLLRIFTYGNSFVIEALKNNLSEDQIKDQVLSIISKFEYYSSNLSLKTKKIYKRTEKRFTLFSPDIFRKLNKLSLLDIQKTNLICTPWHFYTRDMRIKNIFNKIRDFNSKKLI